MGDRLEKENIADKTDYAALYKTKRPTKVIKKDGSREICWEAIVIIQVNLCFIQGNTCGRGEVSFRFWIQFGDRAGRIC